MAGCTEDYGSPSARSVHRRQKHGFFVKRFPCGLGSCPVEYSTAGAARQHRNKEHGWVGVGRLPAKPDPAKIERLRDRFVRGDRIDTTGILELLCLTRKKAS